MIIVATDAPVNERQLKRLAKRAGIGLGRTGTHIHNGSGDIIIAFTNGFTIPHKNDRMTMAYELLRDDHPIMNDLFQAVIEATEEAIYQSMMHAETTRGRLGTNCRKVAFVKGQLKKGRGCHYRPVSSSSTSSLCKTS